MRNSRRVQVPQRCQDPLFTEILRVIIGCEHGIDSQPSQLRWGIWRRRQEGRSPTTTSHKCREVLTVLNTTLQVPDRHISRPQQLDRRQHARVNTRRDRMLKDHITDNRKVNSRHQETPLTLKELGTKSNKH
jgi:hypothetical protein